MLRRPSPPLPPLFALLALIAMIAPCGGCSSTSLEYGVSTRAQTYVDFGPPEGILRTDPPRCAVLPAIAVGANEPRSIALDMALDRAIRRPELDAGLDLGFVPKAARDLQVVPHEVVMNLAIVTGHESALRRLEDAGNTEFHDRDALREVGSLVGADYLLQPRLVSVTVDNASRFTFAGFSFLRTGWTTVEAVLQMWHAPTGRLVWQSSGQVNLVIDNVVGTSPSIQSAFDAIMSTLMIDLATGRAISLVRGRTVDPETSTESTAAAPKERTEPAAADANATVESEGESAGDADPDTESNATADQDVPATSTTGGSS